MDLRAQRAREATRCPYCHDRLGLETLEEQPCPACGAVHHAECLRELLRCAAIGCERPLDPGVADLLTARDSPRLRSLRLQLRLRAQAFVDTNARAVDLEAQLAEALAQRRRARTAGDRRAVEDATIEVIALGRRLDREAAARAERDGGASKPGPGGARSAPAPRSPADALRRRRGEDSRWSWRTWAAVGCALAPMGGGLALVVAASLEPELAVIVAAFALALGAAVVAGLRERPGDGEGSGDPEGAVEDPALAAERRRAARRRLTDRRGE